MIILSGIFLLALMGGAGPRHSGLAEGVLTASSPGQSQSEQDQSTRTSSEKSAKSRDKPPTGTSEKHIELARKLASEGDLEGAIAEYRTALQIDPQDSTAYTELGGALDELGERPAALVAYREVVRLNPESAEAHYNLGIALERDSADLDGGMAEYRKAIALDPEFSDAHYNLGLVLEKRARYDDALLRKVAGRLVKPRNFWPIDDLISRCLDTVNNPPVLDRRLDELAPASRQLLAVLGHSRQPHWSLGNAVELAMALGQQDGLAPVLDLLEAGLLYIRAERIPQLWPRSIGKQRISINAIRFTALRIRSWRHIRSDVKLSHCSSSFCARSLQVNSRVV